MAATTVWATLSYVNMEHTCWLDSIFTFTFLHFHKKQSTLSYVNMEHTCWLDSIFTFSSLSLFLKSQIKQHLAHLLPGFNSHLLYTPAIPIFNLSILYKSPTFPAHHHHHSPHAPVSQVWLQPQGLLLGVRGSKAAHHIG